MVGLPDPVLLIFPSTCTEFTKIRENFEFTKTVYTQVYKFLSSEGAGGEVLKGTFLPSSARAGSHTGVDRGGQGIEKCTSGSIQDRE